jgi:hypothetical protein
MDRERSIPVVLGEAEPDAGILRFVLEGEGFDIVGMASSDDELERVLRGARPSVIVLDAGISARAALEAKEQASGATLVVVWPHDVVAGIADEHVEPHLVIDELGPAVLSASRRAVLREAPIRIPDTIGEVLDRWREAEAVLAPAAAPERPEPPRLDRSTRGVLVAALTWILVLTTLATIAVGVPHAIEIFDEAGRHPSPSAHPASPSPTPGASAKREPSVTGPGAGPSVPQACGSAATQAAGSRLDRPDGCGAATEGRKHAVTSEGAGGRTAGTTGSDQGQGAGNQGQGDQGQGEGDQGLGEGDPGDQGQGGHGQGDQGLGEGDQGLGQGDQGLGEGDQGQGDQGQDAQGSENEVGPREQTSDGSGSDSEFV